MTTKLPKPIRPPAVEELRRAGFGVTSAQELDTVWTATPSACTSRFVLALDHDNQPRLFRID